jgi:hypothetical protein
MGVVPGRSAGGHALSVDHRDAALITGTLWSSPFMIDGNEVPVIKGPRGRP